MIVLRVHFYVLQNLFQFLELQENTGTTTLTSWSPMLWDRNQKPQRFLNWRRSLAAKDLWSTDDPSPPGETTLIRSSDRLHLCSLISPQRHTKRKYTNTCIHTYTLTQTHTHTTCATNTYTHTHTMALFRLLHQCHVWSMIGPNSYNLEENPLDFILPEGSFMLTKEF